MEKTPLVSIIVAVYKAEEYLDFCVDSITAQTYNNLEIILVDDGSPDRSGEVAENLAASDHRIRVIHKTNGGAGSAWNVGVKEAKGDYITTIDGDDFVHPDMIRRQLELLEEYQAEIVVTRHQEVNNRFFPKEQLYQCSERLEQKEAVKKLIEDREIQSFFWGKLYKTSLIKDVYFPEEYTYEDTAAIAGIFLKTPYVVYSPSVYYYYFQNPNSVLHSRDLNLNLQQLMAYERQMAEIVAVYPEYQMWLESRHLKLEMSTWRYYYTEYRNQEKYRQQMSVMKTDMMQRYHRIVKKTQYLSLKDRLRYFRCIIEKL